MRPIAAALWIGLIAIACACGVAATPPQPETRGMEVAVQRSIATARSTVLDLPSATSWGTLADLLLVHGLNKDAAVCYAEAARLDDDPFVWLYLGAMTRRADADLDTTSELFQRALALQPQNSLVRLRYALFLQSIPRALAAAEQFRVATEIDPQLARAFRGLGESSLALDRNDDSIEALERALELEPADRIAGSALAQAYLRTGRSEDAARVAVRAQRGRELDGFNDELWNDHIVRNGVSVSRRFKRVTLALRDGDLDTAREQVSAILELREEDADGRFLLGLVEARSGSPRLAQLQFDRALRADPTHRQALLGSASLAESSGRYEQARRLIERAHSLAPGDPTVLVALAANRRRAADAAGLIEVYERLVAIDPELVVLQLELAGLYMEQRNWSAAERQTENALRLAPGLAAAHQRLGRVYEETGRRRLAVEAYRRAVELDPASGAAQRLRALEISGD